MDENKKEAVPAEFQQGFPIKRPVDVRMQLVTPGGTVISYIIVTAKWP